MPARRTASPRVARSPSPSAATPKRRSASPARSVKLPRAKKPNLAAWQQKALTQATSSNFISQAVGDQKLSGESNTSGAPPWTPAQRVIMALSSLLYLASAYCWHRFGFLLLSRCFCAVSILSVGADAGGGLLPEQRVMRPLRMADRTVGTVGLLSSVITNSNSPLNTFFSVMAMLTSLCFLARGRQVSRAAPLARWRYLAWHASWHGYGAAALVAITLKAQS